MAKLTLSEAARACKVSRTTIQRAVKSGRLSLDAEHRVDTAELLRVGYQLDAAVLHAASQQDAAPVQQDAAPQRSTTQQQGAAPHELQLLRQERDALQRERDLLMQQVDMLRSMGSQEQAVPFTIQTRLSFDVILPLWAPRGPVQLPLVRVQIGRLSARERRKS